MMRKKEIKQESRIQTKSKQTNSASFSSRGCSWNYPKKTKITKIKEQKRKKVFMTTEVKIRAADVKKNSRKLFYFKPQAD